MGLTAENLANDFQINRDRQDRYALDSHQKACKARKEGVFSEEIVPVAGPSFKDMCLDDDGPRADQSMEALTKLRPYFDRRLGSVTVGNACPITDGAGCVLLMRASKAKALGIEPLGFLKGYSYAGLDPTRMGLGPVFATDRLLQETGMAMSDFDLVELNEAFAVQVLACQEAFDSTTFASRFLNRASKLGVLDSAKLNVNGGAVALGHPVGTTGIRLVLTLLKALRRQGSQHGLATLCVGGGQGGAMALEVE